MPAYSVPYVHSGDPAYAPPLLRAPSPTSSIGTDYGPDEPEADENLLSDNAFARTCQAKLRLNEARKEEEFACFDPLLPKCIDAEQENHLYMRVMQHLRGAVRHLQADALFEQTLERGTVITEEQKPSSSDLDRILESMMGTAISPAESTPAPAPPTPLPTNDDLLGGKPMLDFPSPSAPGGFIFPTPSAADASTPAANRRVTRNMGKSRR
ncbi:hypothetical protein PHLGIDRAFT_66002 [Phlebiopsis gigantea 11061_1 CR5-6]|uniref:Uncharacterized protein n=1 Tax=Phlebiopsis gigantea (strain 11061_1 CR5-6) TaxID=745531 RepID=A0A0C3PS79_PHLG1|nr:hypothetical protein PHLGIDRAFT_66002 [Phlebiopsis gigantea 11061_1 CR5-6]